MQNVTTIFSEEDIRPAQLVNDKQRFVDCDRDFLCSCKTEWVEVDCPACTENKRHPYGSKAGFDYVMCDSCRMVYTSPRPSRELLHAFYKQSLNYKYWNEHIFPATETVRRERIFRPRAQRLIKIICELGLAPKSLLEVGAAFGTFLEELRDSRVIERIIGLEPTPDLAKTLREKGFEVIESFIEDVEETAFVDAVAAYEVIEHLFSAEEFIKLCARLLTDQGLLVLSCPNSQGFDLLTLGVQASSYDHEHVNYFNPGSLKQLVERCGFKTLQVLTPGELDADIVRKRVVAGDVDVSTQPFLRTMFLERWDEAGTLFQHFLKEANLSSHMWLIAQKQ